MASGLRGASADALAALRQRIEGTGDAARTGDELFAVAQLLRAEPALRRAATDVSTAAEAKAGLVHGLLEGKVGADTLDLVADAVGRRWTSTRDLADALELLGVVAVVKSAASDAARFNDELFEVAQLVNDHAELRNALSDPTRSQGDKAGLLRGLLEGRALPATVRLAEQSLTGSYRTVTVALEEYAKVAADVHGERVANVTVAKPLTDAELERLTGALSRQYGRPVHANVVVDPAVIGGIKVEIGDDVIDGAVASRLDNARRRLVG